MYTLFYAMAEYLQRISAEELKTLFVSGIVRRASDLDSNNVIIDVDNRNVYMTADIGDNYYSVWYDGEIFYAVYDENDHSPNLVEICNFEDFMLGFIPWYHAELHPPTTKSLDAPIIKKTHNTKTNIPFLGI